MTFLNVSWMLTKENETPDPVLQGMQGDFLRFVP